MKELDFLFRLLLLWFVVFFARSSCSLLAICSVLDNSSQLSLCTYIFVLEVESVHVDIFVALSLSYLSDAIICAIETYIGFAALFSMLGNCNQTNLKCIMLTIFPIYQANFSQYGLLMLETYSELNHFELYHAWYSFILFSCYHRHSFMVFLWL